MTEGIAAECYRPVLRVLKELFLCCTSFERFRERRNEIIDMYIQVHRRPMTFIVTHLRRAIRGSRASVLLKQADFSIPGLKNNHTRYGRRGFVETKGPGVELNGVFEVWHVDAN
jgi:hypothetical protein